MLRRADIGPLPDRRRTDSASAIMLAALDHGPVARSTVARLAGLSPAAVSRQCAELRRRGLLRDVMASASTGRIQQRADKIPGRPHVPVDIDTSGPVVCGLHIAVAQATLSLVDLRGRVLAREQIPHVARDPARVLARIAARLPAFAGTPRRVLGVGVATGGWVDPGEGVIVDHPVLGWRDVPVRDLLERQIGLPVRADGHSRALAQAEQLFGDVRARSSVVHLFVGNVVDAAFAVGGVLQHGPRSAAGSIAHVPVPGRHDPCTCGRHGCLQAVVSETALARRAARSDVIANGGFRTLLDAARAGDPRAGLIFRQRARAVGSAAAVLVGMLNPEVLIVVEAGATHLPGCLEVLRAEVRRGSRGDTEVISTSFGGNVLPVAAGAVMLSAVYADPLALTLTA
jgi:predicted NBD/HSP70 family sugar kinase